MANDITGSFAFAAFNTRASMKHYTRFRAYQLPNKGSSFSLNVDNHFTLIEARYNETKEMVTPPLENKTWYLSDV